jgi:hypothetical protein
VVSNKVIPENKDYLAEEEDNGENVDVFEAPDAEYGEDADDDGEDKETPKNCRIVSGTWK